MMLVVGYFSIQNSKVDVFPEFAPPQVEVQTIAVGLTSTEVESLVTVPLEQALEGVPDLDTIRSKSVPQLSAIDLFFNRGTDLFHGAAARRRAAWPAPRRSCPPGPRRR